MDEAKLKDDLTAYLRANLLRFVIFRHEDRSTYGIPDLSVTGLTRTSWLEVKFANPDCRSRGNQDLSMLRLANVGLARYVIFSLVEKHRYTSIVEPKVYKEWQTSGDHVSGFAFDWIAEQIRRMHTS